MTRTRPRTRTRTRTLTLPQTRTRSHPDPGPGHGPGPRPIHRQPPRLLGRFPQPRRQRRRQRPRLHPPPPVPPRPPRVVHPRRRPQPEHILRLEHRHPRRRSQRQPDQPPPRLALDNPKTSKRTIHKRTLTHRQTGIPPPRRVVIVRARVHDPVLGVVLEPMHAPRRPRVEAELEHDHPRKSERLAKRSDRRRDHAEVLGHDRQRPELPLERVEQGPAGPSPPPAARRCAGPGRHRPVRHEPAEVVEPDEIEMRARAAGPLDPPAVPVPAHRRPVVHRVPPQLPVVGERVRWRAGHQPIQEQLRMGAMVGAPRGHVDRYVTEQPNPRSSGI